MNKVAIFASGSGTNAENIIEHFDGNSNLQIKKVFTNNKKAYVIERCKKLNIPIFVFTKNQLYDGIVLEQLKKDDINWIVLAGFLLRIPKVIIEHYPQKIINIHPALLPKYGGKGMYGDNVHLAVKQAQEPETGITIHFVNENYDEGAIIFQQSCKILQTDTIDAIADKVHSLEYAFYPKILESVIK